MSKFNFQKGLKSDLRYHLIEYYSHRYIFLRGKAGILNSFAVYHLKMLKRELSTIKADVTLIEKIKHHTAVFNIKPQKIGRPQLTISKVLDTI
mgnify:CR=1 FL=1